MPYVVAKTIGKKPYFYLTESVRIAGKVKKVYVYVGTKRPKKAELRKYGTELRTRVESYLKSADPLFSLLESKDIGLMRKAKDAYAKLMRQEPAAKENYYEWFVTTFTYNSNAIEGSTLTPLETSMVLFEGISPSGRPIRDIRAAENHKKAFDFITKYDGDITKGFILKIHGILARDILEKHQSGKIRNVQVYVRGATEIPPRPEDVGPQLTALLKWYKARKKRYHPVVVASYFHTIFEGIHPFVDFNGRTGRLLLNFILMKNGFPPIDIRNRGRFRYYNAIRLALRSDLKPFMRLVIKYTKEMSGKL